MLANSYSRQQENAIVALCHAIAVASLRNIISDGTIKQEYLGIKQSDIAYDCIAELFRKDDSGNVLYLQAYFSSFSFTSLTDNEILAHLRRIVQSRVNQGLQRIYQEADPALGKILRGIKGSINSLHNFNNIERFAKTYIAPVECDLLFHLPEMPRTTLELELGARVKGSENIPTMLAQLSLLLREQEEFRRMVPLMALALVIRSLYSRGMKFEEVVAPKVEETMMLRDTELLVRQACDHIKRETEEKYLRVKRVSPKIFDRYFLAVEKNVFESIMGTNGEEGSLYRALKLQLPALTQPEYRDQHKHTLEYIARLCRNEALRRLGKE